MGLFTPASTPRGCETQHRLDKHSSEWAILGEQEILAENQNRNITRNWETQKHFQEIAKEGQNHVFGNITHNFPKVRRML